MNDNKSTLMSLLKEIEIILSDEQLIKLDQFIKTLLDANQSVNLTSITDYHEAIVKHIYDSLVIMALPEFQSAKTVIDVGSGGGVPSIPLAISNPTKRITSLEATQKKLNFQNEAVRQLGLSNFTAIWGRAEEIAKQPEHRETYDLAVARAVASLDILAELTIPFVKLNGSAIYYKGKEADNEIVKGTKAINILGAEFHEAKSFTLPNNYGSRVLLVLQKESATPSLYPRKPGVPQKRPI